MHYIDQRLLGKNYLPYNVDLRRDYLPYHIRPKFTIKSTVVKVFTGYEILNRKYEPIFGTNTQTGIFMRIDTKLATLLSWNNTSKFETHKYYDHNNKLRSKKIMMGLHLYEGNGPDDLYWSRLKTLSTLY